MQPDNSEVMCTGIAAAQAKVLTNAEAIMRALRELATWTATLTQLEAAARGVGLRASSDACKPLAGPDELSSLCGLQAEANSAFAELRSSNDELHKALSRLGLLNQEITASM